MGVRCSSTSFPYLPQAPGLIGFQCQLPSKNNLVCSFHSASSRTMSCIPMAPAKDALGPPEIMCTYYNSPHIPATPCIRTFSTPKCPRVLPFLPRPRPVWDTSGPITLSLSPCSTLFYTSPLAPPSSHLVVSGNKVAAWRTQNGSLPRRSGENQRSDQWGFPVGKYPLGIMIWMCFAFLKCLLENHVTNHVSLLSLATRMLSTGTCNCL